MGMIQAYEEKSNYRGVFRAILQFGKAYNSWLQQLLFSLESSFFIYNN